MKQNRNLLKGFSTPLPQRCEGWGKFLTCCDLWRSLDFKTELHTVQFYPSDSCTSSDICSLLLRNPTPLLIFTQGKREEKKKEKQSASQKGDKKKTRSWTWGLLRPQETQSFRSDEVMCWGNAVKHAAYKLTSLGCADLPRWWRRCISQDCWGDTHRRTPHPDWRAASLAPRRPLKPHTDNVICLHIVERDKLVCCNMRLYK